MILPKLLLPLLLLSFTPAIAFAETPQAAAKKSKIATPAGWSDDFIR